MSTLGIVRGLTIGQGIASLVLMACVPMVSGVDPGALGYGPGPSAELADGYDLDPVPRPAPSPWEPAQRSAPARSSALDKLDEPTQPVAPSPDVVRVCQHVVAVADPSAPVDAEDCLRSYQIAQVFRTLPDWKTFAACVEAAKGRAAIDSCERATPKAFVEIEAYPLESRICLHLFALTIVEELGADPQLDASELAEFEEVLDECVTSFVEEERSERSPAEYVEMLACIDTASTSAAVESCELSRP